MNPDALDLNLPMFDRTGPPPPVLTLEEWLEWTDEVRRCTPPEHFERWIRTESHGPADQPFEL